MDRSPPPPHDSKSLAASDPGHLVDYTRPVLLYAHVLQWPCTDVVVNVQEVNCCCDWLPMLVVCSRLLWCEGFVVTTAKVGMLTRKEGGGGG